MCGSFGVTVLGRTTKVGFIPHGDRVEKLALLGLRDWWGGRPGPRGTPSSRCRANDISIMQSANRPTGASAADQGVRPTIPAGGF